MRSRAIRSLTTRFRRPALVLRGIGPPHRNVNRRFLWRHVSPPLCLCPHFVRIAAPCGNGARNPVEFLASSPHPQDQESLLSSCRNRIDSIPRPRLTLHELLPLGLGSDGMITGGDEILVRPCRRDWSRPAGQSTLCFHPSGSRQPLPRRENSFLFNRLSQCTNRRSTPGLRVGSG